MFQRLFHLVINIMYWCSILVVLYFAGQVLLFASFRIPTDSMQPGLTGGDYAMVWKPTLGARLFNLFNAIEGKKVGIYRLPGWRKVRRNDVLVFHFPYPYPHRSDSIGMHMLKYYVKRCVALPGDTFRIDGGIYRVSRVTDTLGIYHRQVEMSGIDNSVFPPNIFRCFPYDSVHGWNLKYFGPLYVPRRGDKVTMDVRNTILYASLIAYETGKQIEIGSNSLVYLDGERLYSYTFVKNYYFMAGDWVFDSRDSRYWGLLPDDLIVGRAAFIWKSIDTRTGKFRWERFLKGIR